MRSSGILAGMNIQDTPVSQLTLFLPGCKSQQGLPDVFARLLARADTMHAPVAQGIERHLALFGIDPQPGRDAPVAAITRVADFGVIDNDWWIRADPVHLAAQRDGLILHPDPGLTAAESERLTTELNEALAADGWLIKSTHPGRWYLKQAGEPRITTTPLNEAAGRNVHALLPQGDDRRLWHTRLNELQILLHTSPVNADRETRGLMSANSVWFWGGGRLPRLGKTAWTTIWADDPLTRGLARLAECVVRVPQEYSPSATHTEQELMALDLRHGNEPLQAVVAALHNGACRSLTVLMESGPAYRCLRWHRWRFWRRPEAAPPAEVAL